MDSRRKMLESLAGAAAFLALSVESLGSPQSPQPMASPNAPRNQNVPGGLDPAPMKPDKPPPNPLMQEQIAAWVQQLFKLAGELRDEVQQTNLNATFSVSFIKKAHQIEKLAKQIKDRAKG